MRDNSTFSLSENGRYYILGYKLWGKNLKVKVMTDDENILKNALDDITDKLARIDRNREKISRKIYDGMHEYVSEDVDSFCAGLYISSVSCEIYADNSVDVMFKVKSRHEYTLDVYYECMVFPDNSFEI